MTAQTPGKLILAGEHAVVYGQPALVTAVNRHATCTIEDSQSQAHEIVLDNIDEQLTLTPAALLQLENMLEEKHQAFVHGNLSVNEILSRPAEMAAYALSSLYTHIHQTPDHGLSLRVESTIPVGCGMGSSAAIAISVLKAAASLTGADLDQDALYDLAFRCEQLQHGNPSGADPFVCLHGGMHRFRKGQSVRLPDIERCYHLVQTGRPDAGTGECVSHVAKHFQHSGLWPDFAIIARRLEDALLEDDLERLQEAVADNQALLKKIQVVPPRVDQFIQDLQKQGCAAKICGAGSVTGSDHAGVVWVTGPTPPVEICKDYGYSPITVEGDFCGAKAL